MNENLKRYSVIDGWNSKLWDENTPIAERRVFDSKEAKIIPCAKVLEVLRTSPFLDLETIGNRLNILAENDDEADMTMIELLNYHEINYEPIIRKRLMLIDYSREKIVEALSECTKVGDSFLPSIIEGWYNSRRFEQLWNELEPVLHHMLFMLDFYSIKCEEFNGGFHRSLDEEEFEDLIPVQVGDEVEVSNRVIRFSKFHDM